MTPDRTRHLVESDVFAPDQYHGRMVVVLPSGTYGTVLLVAETRDKPAFVAFEDFTCVTAEDREHYHLAQEAALTVTRIPPSGDTAKAWVQRDRKVWAELHERGVSVICRWAEERGDPFPHVGRPMTDKEYAKFAKGAA